MDVSPDTFLLFRMGLRYFPRESPFWLKGRLARDPEGVAMWPAAAFPRGIWGRPGRALGFRSKSKSTISCVHVPDEHQA